MKMRKTNNRGITLIALIITIIVLLILAGVTIAMLMGENGILTQASEAKIKTILSGYKEEVNLYKTNKKSENNGFIEGSLTAGKTNLTYNTQKQEEIGNIKTVITSINKEYMEKLEIIKGKLLINTKDKNEIKVAQSLGIEVNPYDITEDGELLSSNGNLLLMDETGTLTIPDSVTKIGEGAFANLEGLKTIIIPGNVKEIGVNAFAYNTTLETVIMQEGVRKIGNSAFKGCSSLKNISMPESIEIIEPSAFMYDSMIEEIRVPSKIKEISVYTFYDCRSLNEVILPEGLNKIESYAFFNTKFTEIKIPSTISEIGNNVFSGNKNLNNIIIKGEKPEFVYEEGMLMPKTKDIILFISDAFLRSIKTFNIPNGINSFDMDISNYSNINKLVIPNTLTNISMSLFPLTIENIEVETGNSKLAVDTTNKILYTKDTKEIICCYSKEENINLKNLDIIKLKAYSFRQAFNATNITLPDRLENIENQVFSGCTKIQEINIGANVTYIHSNFKYGNYSGTVKIDSLNNNYMIENNVLYSKNQKDLVTVLYKIQGSFTVNNKVENILDYAFHNQHQMTQIVIQEGLKEIGRSFNYCKGLSKINIPSTVEKIDKYCFNESPNISQINIDKKEGTIEGAPWGATKGMKVVNWKK